MNLITKDLYMKPKRAKEEKNLSTPVYYKQAEFYKI